MQAHLQDRNSNLFTVAVISKAGPTGHYAQVRQTANASSFKQAIMPVQPRGAMGSQVRMSMSNGQQASFS